MTYQISTTTIDPATGQTQYATLAYLAGVFDWSGFYAKVHDYMALPDDNGTSADSNVQEWFAVAAQANAGIGAASDLIRDYTSAQIEIRLGQTVSTATLDKASDRIAASIWISMENSNGTIPTLPQIAQFDANQVVAVLQEDGYDVDISVWSGNLLFAGLGDTQPFQDNLLNYGDSYDLVVALESLLSVDPMVAGSATWTSLSLDTFLGGGSAMFHLANYIGETYGAIGAASLSMQGLNRLLDGGIQAGRQGDVDDLMVGTAADNLIHAGGSDDIVLASAGHDFLDGGDGIDTFDLSHYASGVYLRFAENVAPGAVSFSGHVTAHGVEGMTNSTLFAFENIILTGGSDNVMIENAPNFMLVDAGGNDALSGDNITFADLGESVQFDLATGELIIGSNSSTAINFENVYGSEYADAITGAASDNTIMGGDGGDTINGGAGSDIIYGEAGDDVLHAGPAGVGDFDIVSGGAGSDTITGNGSSYLYGNEGADTFCFYAGDLVVDPEAIDTLIYEDRTLTLYTDYQNDRDDQPIVMGAAANSDPLYWYDDWGMVA